MKYNYLIFRISVIGRDSLEIFIRIVYLVQIDLKGIVYLLFI